MYPNLDQYNIAAIRNLLRDAFTPQELRRFCQDRPVFRPVLTRFGSNASLEDMAQVLLEYCQTQVLLADLLQEIQAANPRQYARHCSLLCESHMPAILQIPHNLDPRSEFIGREAEKAEVHQALQRSRLVCIDGIGGIGKTALVLEVAHECLQASQRERPSDGIATFDGFIWTSAKDRDLTLNDLLDAVARTLDYPGIAQKSVEEKPTAARRLLQTRPYLLAVDNYETIADEHVRDFLLKLPEPSKALITSRKREWPEAEVISLTDLSESESLDLMRSVGQRLKLKSVERAEDHELLPICQATGGVPLAIKWAVGQIGQRGQSLDRVLAALDGVTADIFDHIFARSWGLLSVHARRVLMVMPLFATSAARAGVEAASDIHDFALDDALGQLVEMSLVDATDELEESQRRHGIHPLTRSFAEAQLAEGSDFEREARSRLTTYYTEGSSEMGKWGYTEGFSWLEVELPNIFAIMEWANWVQRWKVVISIFRNLVYFLDACGYSQERINYGQMALQAAQQAGDMLAVADCEAAIAWTLWRGGQYDESEKLLRSCLPLYMDKGKTRKAVWATLNLATVAIGKGDLGEARTAIDDAASLAERIGFEPHALHSTQGHIEFESGNLEAARHHFLTALRLSEMQEIATSGVSIGSRKIDLGNVALAESKLEEAAAYFESGLESGYRESHLATIARAKFGLAKVRALSGNKAEALKLASSAWEGFTRMAMEREAAEAIALLYQLDGEK